MFNNLTPESMVESMAYLMTNPVEAGAVRYAKDWPGAHTLPRLRNAQAFAAGDPNTVGPSTLVALRHRRGRLAWPRPRDRARRYIAPPAPLSNDGSVSPRWQRRIHG